MNFTDEQKNAINERGTNILLSAAAGSGKTATLVERVSRLIDEGTHIDEMLIVTFTRAAALGMRKKLSDTLMALAAEGSEVASEELLRLERADISTIHGFCAGFLRENFESAGVDPNFRIMDDADYEQQKEKAINEALENAYEKQDEELLALDFGRGRRKLFELADSLMEWLETRPEPENWIMEALSIDPAVWKNMLADACRKRIKSHIEQCERFIEMEIPDHYKNALNEDISNLCLMLGESDTRMLAMRVKVYKNTTPRGRNGGCDEELLDTVKKVRESFSKTLASDPIRLLAEDCADEDVAVSLRNLKRLYEIVAEANDLLSEVKRERGMLTYSDLEMFTLNALMNDDTARAVREKYKYIFVDEYQDTSDAQEAILTRVARGDNMFMVGDVKQSIYRFRNAEPRLFLSKYSQYSEGNGGKMLPLTMNFRSSERIVEFVNTVFERLMTGGDSMIEYDANARLNAGTGMEGVKTDCYILEGEADEEYSKDMREGIMIAQIIKSEMAADPGLKYSDFAVLTRQKAAAFKALMPVLMSEGIPCFAEGAGGYYDALEVRLALSLLSVIDNLYNDVELIGLLRSCVCRLSNDELALVRLTDRDCSFAEAVEKYAEGEDELAARLRAFLEMIADLNRLSPDVTLGELTRIALERSGIYAYVGALPSGEVRRANLDMLIEKAADYDANVSGSLNRFLAYARKLSEKEDAQTANPLSENSNVVRLMTVHHSKGLEFRIVIAARLDRLFKHPRNEDSLLCHPMYGLGIMRCDERLSTRRSTYSRAAIQSVISREETAEDIRVLYVLLTRARERLILTGTSKDWNKTLEAVSQRESDPAGASSPLLMLLAALGRDRLNEYLNIKTVCTADITLNKEETECGKVVETDEEYIDRLLWTYPYAGSEYIPLKLTASGLLRSLDAPGGAEEMVRRPVFMQEKGLTGTETGTAYHRAMQLLDIQRLRAMDEREMGEEIARQLDDMASRHIFTSQERSIIRVGRLVTFFASRWGRLMMDAEDLRRELRFNVLMDASEALTKSEARGSGGELLVQGSIDCCFIVDGEWVLLDYKTNRADDLDELTEHYRPQLELYSGALERISGISVGHKVLCLLSQSKWIEV